MTHRLHIVCDSRYQIRCFYDLDNAATEQIFSLKKRDLNIGIDHCKDDHYYGLCYVPLVCGVLRYGL